MPSRVSLKLLTLIIVSDLYLHLGMGLRANVWNVNSRMVNDYFEEIKIYDIYDYTLYDGKVFIQGCNRGNVQILQKHGSAGF